MKKRIAIVTAIVAAGVVGLGGTSIAVASSLPEGAAFSLVPAALSESTASDDLTNAQSDDNDHDDDVVDSHDDVADDVDGNADDDRNDADDHGDDVVSEADFAAASAAALAAAGGGTVTDVESSDDGDHAWEVDVTLASGGEVDVELDASFTLVRVDND